ncbi:MAG TPA: hypothetical protein VEJ87_08995 [Acidimicrobiales bacterium]|nr:hypothetical protein [Acidimicrobiales bacterium]
MKTGVTGLVGAAGGWFEGDVEGDVDGEVAGGVIPGMTTVEPLDTVVEPSGAFEVAVAVFLISPRATSASVVT